MKTAASRAERAVKTWTTKARAAIKAIRLGEAGALESDYQAATRAIEKLEGLERVTLCECGEDALAALRATIAEFRADRAAAMDLRYAAASAAIGRTPRRELTAAESGYEREIRLMGVRAV